MSKTSNYRRRRNRKRRKALPHIPQVGPPDLSGIDIPLTGDPLDRAAIPGEYYSGAALDTTSEVVKRPLFPRTAIAALVALLVLRLVLPTFVSLSDALRGFFEGFLTFVLGATAVFFAWSSVHTLVLDHHVDDDAPKRTALRGSTVLAIPIAMLAFWAAPTSLAALGIFCVAVFTFAPLALLVVEHAHGWERARAGTELSQVPGEPFTTVWRLPSFSQLLWSVMRGRAQSEPMEGVTDAEKRERARFDSRAPFIVLGALLVALVAFALLPDPASGGLLAVLLTLAGLSTYAYYELDSYRQEHGLTWAYVTDRVRAALASFPGYYEEHFLGNWNPPLSWHDRQRQATYRCAALAAATILLGSYFWPPLVLPRGLLELAHQQHAPSISPSSSPEAWLKLSALVLFKAPQYWPEIFGAWTLAFVACLFVPLGLCWSLLLALCGRPLLHIAHRWDSEVDEQAELDKRFPKKDHTRFDEVVKRLRAPHGERSSPYAKHILCGFRTDTGEPNVFSIRALRGHMLVSGATEAGKTSRVYIPLIKQLIGLRDFNLVVIDPKKDDALFHTTKQAAEEASFDFKWFTTDPTDASFALASFDQKHLTDLPKLNKVAQILRAAGLSYGVGYGRGFYTSQNTDVLLRILSVAERRGIKLRSFLEIANFIEANQHSVAEDGHGDKAVFRSKKQVEAALGLMTKMRELASVPAMNVVRGGASLWPHLDQKRYDAAGEHGIQWGDFVRYPSVVYLCLTEALSSGLNKEIAGLVLFHLLAAHQIAGRRKRPCVLLIDEAASVLTEEIQLFFQLARSAGVYVVAACQDRSQLEAISEHFAAALESNTRLKLVLTANDRRSRDAVIDASGEVQFPKQRWCLDDNEAWVLEPTGDLITGPRYRKDPVMNVSATEGDAFFWNHVDEAPAFYGGRPVAVHLPYAQTPEEYERLEKTEWPHFTDHPGLLPPALELGEPGPIVDVPPTVTPDEARNATQDLFDDDPKEIDG